MHYLFIVHNIFVSIVHIFANIFLICKQIQFPCATKNVTLTKYFFNGIPSIKWTLMMLKETW